MNRTKKFVDLIGLEREFWLINYKSEIIEPALYGFPHDEFGFLIELRTLPLGTVESLMNDYKQKLLHLIGKAIEVNCNACFTHRKPLDKDFIYKLRAKYDYNRLPDLTANIYDGITSSHATGITEDYYGTAGIHIHFSRHDNHGNRVQLPIFHIVRSMDLVFYEEIKKAKRIHGEYEIKPHGFEYRSLPTNVDVSKAINIAFQMLRWYR